jgi:hypothetical protein
MVKQFRVNEACLRARHERFVTISPYKSRGTVDVHRSTLRHRASRRFLVDTCSSAIAALTMMNATQGIITCLPRRLARPWSDYAASLRAFLAINWCLFVANVSGRFHQ